MFEPPVDCNVCKRCTCFCAKSPTDMLFESGDEYSDLLVNIEKIKEREDYLHYFRKELEARVLLGNPR